MIVDGVSALSTRVVTRICTTCVFPTPVTFCYDLYQYLFVLVFLNAVRSHNKKAVLSQGNRAMQHVFLTPNDS